MNVDYNLVCIELRTNYIFHNSLL